MAGHAGSETLASSETLAGSEHCRQAGHAGHASSTHVPAVDRRFRDLIKVGLGLFALTSHFIMTLLTEAGDVSN